MSVPYLREAVKDGDSEKLGLHRVAGRNGPGQPVRAGPPGERPRPVEKLRRQESQQF